MLAIAVYANTLPNGFAYDDIPLVRDNPEIRSTGDLPRLFSRPYWPGDAAAGLYRPLTIASLALNRAVTGPAATGFHAVNVLLHALVSLLCWYALRSAGLRYGTALFGAALFAVHPLHTEAVANIAGRGELLAAGFVLLAWLAHRRGFGEGNGASGWAALAGLAYLAGTLSKEQAFVAPALFLLDDGCRDLLRNRSLVVKRYGVYLIAATAALWMRSGALGGLRGAETQVLLDNPAAYDGSLTRIATALWVQVRYIGLGLWPGRLSSDYSFDAVPVVNDALDPRGWAGAVLFLALLAATLVAVRRSRPLALGLGCWLLFLLPASNLFFPAGTLMAERLTYLPSVGLCLIFGHLLARGLRLPTAGGPPIIASPAVIVLTAVLVVTGGARTIARNPVWKDSATLALNDVAVMPHSAKLQLGAGLALLDRGKAGAAEAALDAAVTIYPDYAQARYYLARVLLARGAEDEALSHMEAAARLATVNPAPSKELARLLESRGRRDDALLAYARGCAMDPADPAFCFNYGRALLAAGRNDEAAAALDGVARRDPDSLPGRLSAALAAEIRGETAAALAAYREMLRNPDLTDAIRANVTARLAALEAAESGD